MSSRRCSVVLSVTVCAATLLGGGVANASTGPRVRVAKVAAHYVGTVNLGTAAQAHPAGVSAVRAFPQGASLAGQTPSGSYRIVDQAIVNYRHRITGGTAAPTAPPPYQIGTGQVPGEGGFWGLNGYQQAVVNNGIDLEPPDQGLCAGNGQVADFVNNALAVYDQYGDQLENTLPSYKIFKQPSTAFMSDPRCYYDQATQRWFLTEFIVGTNTKPSIQFIAVSNTNDLLGSFTIWSINTTDSKTAGCPCFGDFDQFGADNNGVYIATNEFSNEPPFSYNGVIIYALSKQTLEQFATTGIAPVVFRYRLMQDQFGQPYHVSPASSPPGATFAPGTEYFVESNGDAFSDHHLLVYAMEDTSLLAQPAPPPLTNVEIGSLGYDFPPNATQKKGPIPLGNANQDPEGTLQTDFDAVQEVTYVGGQLYAELSTGMGSLAGVAWYEITPNIDSSTGKLTAKMAAQGTVSVPRQSLLYPVIALNSASKGYMAFSLSGPAYYPSAAYIPFNASGPSGSVDIAGPGAAPEDSFTCYAAFVGPNYGGCRWGDYSMGVAMGSQIWLATEAIPPTSRDYLTNWGTFVWHAPASG